MKNNLIKIYNDFVSNNFISYDEDQIKILNIFEEIWNQNQKINLQALPKKLRAITRQNVKTTIYVRADHKNQYGRVMALMGTINQAGFQNVALVTESARP